MEPRAHHVLIGVFTVFSAAAALLFILWLGKSHNDTEPHYYIIVFNEAVRGLSKGSAVQYNGIKVGDVVGLTLDPDDPRKVLARIRVDSSVPVKQDTQARLVPTGITGNAVIEFSGGSPESPNLVARDGKNPVIVATPSSIAKLLASSDNLMSDINELILGAKGFLSSDNAQRLDKTLEHLEQITGGIANQGADVKTLIQQLTAAARQADTALQQASQLIVSADSLVNDRGVPALGSAERTLTSLTKASDTIDQLLLDNQNSLIDGMQGFKELGPALQELRHTLISVNRVMRRLEDNPASYLTGREKIQEFEP
ncbi:MAG: MCE family protein [Betaproteobacteria bacterium]|nr:MCE family protein [Betaproteobacteria bacterium]